MHLQPLATTCSVSGEPFVEGMRVASFLVRSGAALEIVRYDVIEAHAKGFSPEGILACRWVQPYKPRKQGENSERALKLTAENLFVALADPTTEPTPENTRLVQFLALMLERKKILRPRGRSTDGARNRFEHARSKQIFEIPAGDLTPEFFVAVQQQLSVLVGGPKTKPGAVVAPPELPVTEADASPSPTASSTASTLTSASATAVTAVAVSAVAVAAVTSEATPPGVTPSEDSNLPGSSGHAAASFPDATTAADTGSTMESKDDPVASPVAPISSEVEVGSEVDVKAALPVMADPETEAALSADAAERGGEESDEEFQADADFVGDADVGVESQAEPEIADAPEESAFPAAEAAERPSDGEKPAPGSIGSGSGGTAAA